MWYAENDIFSEIAFLKLPIPVEVVVPVPAPVRVEDVAPLVFELVLSVLAEFSLNRCRRGMVVDTWC